MKTFIALSVWLSNVPDEHRASNGCCQYLIVVRSKSKKRVCELLDCSYSHMNNFCGLHEDDQPKFTNIPQKDEVIYYLVEHTKHGYVNKWFEYTSRKGI